MCFHFQQWGQAFVNICTTDSALDKTANCFIVKYKKCNIVNFTV